MRELGRRRRGLVRDATAGYERWLTVDVIRAFEAYVDDLSNWYIRRSRRRFWDGDEVALRVLWHALAQTIRVIAPVMPFCSCALAAIAACDSGGSPDRISSLSCHNASSQRKRRGSVSGMPHNARAAGHIP